MFIGPGRGAAQVHIKVGVLRACIGRWGTNQRRSKAVIGPGRFKIERVAAGQVTLGIF